MNKEQFFLTKIAEECTEIAKVALKAQQFGLDNVKEGQLLTNRERLIEELNDLFVILSMMDANDLLVLSYYTDNEVEQKQNKVIKYLNKSIELGLIDADNKQGEN